MEKKCHFRLKISISCLCNLICIFNLFLIKLAEFVRVISSLNGIDFEKEKKSNKQ